LHQTRKGTTSQKIGGVRQIGFVREGGGGPRDREVGFVLDPHAVDTGVPHQHGLRPVVHCLHRPTGRGAPPYRMPYFRSLVLFKTKPGELSTHLQNGADILLHK